MTALWCSLVTAKGAKFLQNILCKSCSKFFFKIMFTQKISQNIDTLAWIHGNVFPWQPAIMGNKASLYKSIFQISLPWLHLFFFNACPRYLKSRRDLLFVYGVLKNWDEKGRIYSWVSPTVTRGGEQSERVCPGEWNERAPKRCTAEWVNWVSHASKQIW